MITTNYQTYGTSGFNLRLRVYQDGETRYVNVNKILQGKLTKRHWSQKKQMFLPSAPFCKENNEAIVQFKRKYDEKALLLKKSSKSSLPHEKGSHPASLCSVTISN